MSNIDYGNVDGVGMFRAVRVWKDHETNEWIVDAMAEDGLVNTQEWSYARLEEALTDVPLLHAVLVSGVRLGEVDGRGWTTPTATAWRLLIPIPDGGLEGSLWPTKAAAETFIRAWVK